MPGGFALIPEQGGQFPHFIRGTLRRLDDLPPLSQPVRRIVALLQPSRDVCQRNRQQLRAGLDPRRDGLVLALGRVIAEIVRVCGHATALPHVRRGGKSRIDAHRSRRMLPPQFAGEPAG